MLGAVRRQGLAQALRACAPRSIPVRATPQVLRWQRPSAATFPFASRSIYSSPSLRNAASGSGAAAQAQVEEPFEQTQDRITEFEDLAARQLVSPKIIDNITKGMNIKTMTEVQSLTINETLKGDDVYVQITFISSGCFEFSLSKMPCLFIRKSFLRLYMLTVCGLQIGPGQNWYWKDPCLPCSRHAEHPERQVSRETQFRQTRLWQIDAY